MNEEEQHSQQAPALFDQYRTNRPETPSISGEVETFEDAPVEPPVVGGAEVGMPLEARRALVLLLRQGVVMADSVEKVASSPCRWQNCSVSERGGE
ncbi:hypothetical protein ACIRTP_28130 [Pseudomonas aeruginosa]|uniref:hypothetical protein n=1 Tax=Pseudomonas aeruginosa TaxID=287 RepID=UPI003D9B02AA